MQILSVNSIDIVDLSNVVNILLPIYVSDRSILTLSASQAIMLMVKYDNNGRICQTPRPSLNSLIIKAFAFELVHIGEEDDWLDRRRRLWHNNDINYTKMYVCDI